MLIPLPRCVCMHGRQNHVLALKRRVCRADLRRGCSVESAGAVGQRDGRPCRPRPCRVEKPTIRRHCTRSYRRLSQGASDVSCAAQAIVRRDRGRGIRVTVPGQRFSSYHQNHRVSTEPRRVRRVAQMHTLCCTCAALTHSTVLLCTRDPGPPRTLRTPLRACSSSSKPAVFQQNWR